MSSLKCVQWLPIMQLINFCLSSSECVTHAEANGGGKDIGAGKGGGGTRREVIVGPSGEAVKPLSSG